MYSAPTDHESVLDLWQCECIIAKTEGWGENKKERVEEEISGFFTEAFFEGCD